MNSWIGRRHASVARGPKTREYVLVAQDLQDEASHCAIRRMRLRLSCPGVIYLLPATAIPRRVVREEEGT